MIISSYLGKPQKIFFLSGPTINREGGGCKGRTTKKYALFFVFFSQSIIRIFYFNDFTLLLNYVVGWQSRNFFQLFFAIFGKKYGSVFGYFKTNKKFRWPPKVLVVGPLKNELPLQGVQKVFLLKYLKYWGRLKIFFRKPPCWLGTDLNIGS